MSKGVMFSLAGELYARQFKKLQSLCTNRIKMELLDIQDVGKIRQPDKGKGFPLQA